MSSTEDAKGFASEETSELNEESRELERSLHELFGSGDIKCTKINLMLAVIKFVSNKTGFDIWNIFDLSNDIEYPLKLKLFFIMDKEKKVELILLKTADLLLISGYFLLPENVNSTRSLMLPISRYLPYRKITKPLSKCFVNYNELTFKLKEYLFVPLRNEIFCTFEFPHNCLPFLLGVPDKILYKIFLYLGSKDVQSFKMVSRRTYDIFQKYIRNKR